MGSITPYETVKGRRYRVRYRKPDRTEAEKRGFTTMREAKLDLSMVTVSKSRGSTSTRPRRGFRSGYSPTDGCDRSSRRCRSPRTT